MILSLKIYVETTDKLSPEEARIAADRLEENAEKILIKSSEDIKLKINYSGGNSKLKTFKIIPKVEMRKKFNVQSSINK